MAGDFDADSQPAMKVTCRARVTARASEGKIREMMVHTDSVTEIQNSLRVLTPVTVNHIEAVPC